MTKDEYWEKFSETGRVADYLAYVAANSYDTERKMDSSSSVSVTSKASSADKMDSDIKHGFQRGF